MRAQGRPTDAQSRTNLAHNWLPPGQCRTNLGHNWPRPGQCRTKWSGNWPRDRQIWAVLVRHWGQNRRSRTNQARIWGQNPRIPSINRQDRRFQPQPWSRARRRSPFGRSAVETAGYCLSPLRGLKTPQLLHLELFHRLDAAAANGRMLCVCADVRFPMPAAFALLVPQGQLEISQLRSGWAGAQTKQFRPARDDGKRHHKYFSSYSTRCFWRNATYSS